MPDLELREGHALSVLPAGGGLTAAYTCRVRSVSPESVLVTSPARDGERLAVSPGDNLWLYFDAGAHIYRLEARVRAVEVEGGAVALDAPRVVERRERREFYRLEHTLEPRYVALVDGAGDEVRRLNDARVLDLSGGGLQLRTAEPVESGDSLRIIVGLDDDQEIDVFARVLSTVAPEPGRTYYRVHGQFIDISRAVQERIVRFVFRKQVELQQRRAG